MCVFEDLCVMSERKDYTFLFFSAKFSCFLSGELDFDLHIGSWDKPG